jgi:hypothetical protein
MGIFIGKIRVDSSPMNFFFYATNLLLLISFAVFVRQMVNAPEGYEDETGFHYGYEGEMGSHVVTPAKRRGALASRRQKSVPAFAKVTARHLAA